MFPKGYKSIAIMILLTLSLLWATIILPSSVVGLDPEFVSVSFDPVDPSFEDEINITVEFNNNDETITQIQIQICHNGSCDLPVDMTDLGDGESFFYNIPHGGFGELGNDVFCYFHLFVTHSNGFFIYPVDMESHELNITITRMASKIMLSATPDALTVFPNETITVTGKVVDDLQVNVSGANVNITVAGEEIENSTTTDEFGDFEISTLIPLDGTYVLNLTVDSDGMMAYEEWDVTVNSWPLPFLSISGEVTFNEEDRPRGETGNVFYSGSTITLTYRVSNTGTGSAFNVTGVLNISTEEEEILVDIGNMTPSPTQRYEGQIELNTSSSGNITVEIMVDWDQMAPEDQKLNYTPYFIDIGIVDPPTWEDHTVLVEMFTQTTCVPCVEVEEVLERLNEGGDLDFELIMYVFDDQASQLKANELGVTSTPDVFFDHTYDRYTGGGTIEELEAIMRSRIENASARDTPPLSITFVEKGEDMTVSLELGSIYSEQVSGIFQVYSIEIHSNMRNQQGIPIANRFHGAVDGADVNGMNPGSVRNLTAPMPDEGKGYIAVLFSPDGSVLQSASYLPALEKDLYMTEDSELIRLTSPASSEVNITLERFQFEDEVFSNVDLSISAVDLPVNWTLDLDGKEITAEGNSFQFTTDNTQKEILPSTRVRFFQDLSIDLNVPEREDGTYSFKILVNVSGVVYKHTVVVIATTTEEPVLPPEITDIYLEGVGQKLYVYVEADNVPEDGMVYVRILPCFEGENAACGIPVTLLLIEQTDGRYRTSVTGVDLTIYTHLTYNGWIEENNVRLVGSAEKKEKIDDLVDISVIGNDDPEKGDNTLIFMISAAVLLVIFIIGVFLFIILKRNQAQHEASEQVQRSEEEGSGIETLEEEPEDEGSIEEGSSTGEEHVLEEDVEPDEEVEGSIGSSPLEEPDIPDEESERPTEEVVSVQPPSEQPSKV